MSAARNGTGVKRLAGSEEASDEVFVSIRRTDRQNASCALWEAALTKARMDAEAIEHTAPAYIIDVALAEIRSHHRNRALNPGGAMKPAQHNGSDRR